MVGAALQIAHVFGLILLLTALVLSALRVFGWALKEYPATQFTDEAARIFWFGLGLAVISGVLMFVATPKLYYFKWAFQLKMLLFAAGLITQTTLFCRAIRRPASGSAKIAVALSLLLWFGVGMAGRIIGFI